MNRARKYETKNPAPQPVGNYGGKNRPEILRFRSAAGTNNLKSGKMKTEANAQPQVNGTAKKEDVKNVTVDKAVQTKAISNSDKTGVNGEPKEKPTTIKPVMNLDQTIELLNVLHVKTVQRNRLMETIATLEAFEIELEKDSDATDANYYQGCKITIEDDNRHKFEAKNPFIIQEVAKFVNKLCVDKLAEIEASIVIP